MNKKTVLVTGGSRGIGKAIAHAFAREGYRVIVNWVNHREQMEKTVNEIKQFSEDVFEMQCDAADFKAVKAMVGRCERMFGAIDVLINNAGIAYTGLFQDMPEEERHRIIDVNVHGVFNVTFCVLKGMIKRHKGAIVNISSVWGEVGGSCEAVYSASKGAVNAFTRALGKELAPAGIRVNAVSCGCIDTEMNNNLTDDEKAALAEEIPVGRFGLCKEVADAVVFLAGDKSSYINGEIITVDGGFI